MTFLHEWLLVWHRAIWFPFNWMVGLESQPAESDQFTVQTDSEDEWGLHAGPLFKLQPDVHINTIDAGEGGESGHSPDDPSPII